eukprot:14079168-Alexandrium_andersonii.AAC.1
MTAGGRRPCPPCPSAVRGFRTRHLCISAEARGVSMELWGGLVAGGVLHLERTRCCGCCCCVVVAVLRA